MRLRKLFSFHCVFFVSSDESGVIRPITAALIYNAIAELLTPAVSAVLLHVGHSTTYRFVIPKSFRIVVVTAYPHNYIKMCYTHFKLIVDLQEGKGKAAAFWCAFWMSL
jgi:hypothetical protein